MKKIVIVMLVLLLLGAAISAQAVQTRASMQVMVTAGKAFGEDQKIAPYIYGYFFSNINEDYFSFVGYGGASINSDLGKLYLMAASYNDGFGLSAGPSVWLEFGDEENAFFIQGDYYFPWRGSEEEQDLLPAAQYFGYASYAKSLEDEKKIGLACEVMGAVTDKAPYETAIGPFVGLGKMQLWVFYDLTPAYAEEDSYGLRFTLNF